MDRGHVDRPDVPALGVGPERVVGRGTRALDDAMAGSPRPGMLWPRRTEQGDDGNPEGGRAVHRPGVSRHHQPGAAEERKRLLERQPAHDADAGPGLARRAERLEAGFFTRASMHHDRRVLVAGESIDQLPVPLHGPVLRRPAGEGIDEDEAPRGEAERASRAVQRRSASLETRSSGDRSSTATPTASATSALTSTAWRAGSGRTRC